MIKPRFRVMGTYYVLNGREKEMLYFKLSNRNLTDFTFFDCQLELDPNNKYDANAIKVFFVEDDYECFIGYVPKRKTKSVRKIMDNHYFFLMAFPTEDGNYEFDLVY